MQRSTPFAPCRVGTKTQSEWKMGAYCRSFILQISILLLIKLLITYKTLSLLACLSVKTDCSEWNRRYKSLFVFSLFVVVTTCYAICHMNIQVNPLHFFCGGYITSSYLIHVLHLPLFVRVTSMGQHTIAAVPMKHACRMNVKLIIT